MSKTLTGLVTKKSGHKTIKVAVTRTVTHPIYKKKYKVTKQYLVHDENEKVQVGDTVTITQAKPFSKTKHFKITE